MDDFNSREYWNNIWQAEGSDTWRRYPATVALFSQAVVPTVPAQRVLDLGCGIGVLASVLKANGNRVVGMDISNTALDLLYKNYEIFGFLGRVPPLPFADNSFDTITAAHFLEHFDEVEADLLLKETARVAPVAVLCVPNNCLGNEVCKEHHNKFTEPSFQALLAKHYSSSQIIAFEDVFLARNKQNAATLYRVPSLFAICRR